jgi:hypothetical protein
MTPTSVSCTSQAKTIYMRAQLDVRLETSVPRSVSVAGLEQRSLAVSSDEVASLVEPVEPVGTLWDQQ